MSKPMTAARLAEIELENKKVWERVKRARNGGHVFSVATVESDCQVTDELTADVRRLRECIANAPQPNGITVTDIEAFRKWQRESLGDSQ